MPKRTSLPGNHERRYVYGRRKTGPSKETIWLLAVILVGLIILLLLQLAAYWRARSLAVEATVLPVVIAMAGPTPRASNRCLRPRRPAVSGLSGRPVEACAEPQPWSQYLRQQLPSGGSAT